MIARSAIGVVVLIASTPALPKPLDAAARSRSAGRVFGDGSVIGTVQFRGAVSIYSVWLPAGTSSW